MTPLWSGISDKRQTRIRKAVLKEDGEAYRRRLELSYKETLKKEVVKDWEYGQPTEQERAAFDAFARDVEEGSYALALVASRQADRLEKKRNRIGLGSLVFTSLWFASCFILAASGSVVGIYGTFWPSLWSIALVAYFKGLTSNVESLRCHSTRYRQLSERSRTERTVESLGAGRNSLELFREALQRAKNGLDERYHPRLEDLEAARTEVRFRIETESQGLFEAFDKQLAASTEGPTESDSTPELRQERI